MNTEHSLELASKIEALFKEFNVPVKREDFLDYGSWSFHTNQLIQPYCLHEYQYTLCISMHFGILAIHIYQPDSDTAVSIEDGGRVKYMVDKSNINSILSCVERAIKKLKDLTQNHTHVYAKYEDTPNE